jgi:hypothetical protein
LPSGEVHDEKDGLIYKTRMTVADKCKENFISIGSSGSTLRSLGLQRKSTGAL